MTASSMQVSSLLSNPNIHYKAQPGIPHPYLLPPLTHCIIWSLKVLEGLSNSTVHSARELVLSYLTHCSICRTGLPHVVEPPGGGFKKSLGLPPRSDFIGPEQGVGGKFLKILRGHGCNILQD